MPATTKISKAAINVQRRRDNVTVIATIDFEVVNQAALAVLPNLLQRWLPDGRVRGQEFVALNPTRADRRPGSFKINIHSGQWADFATGDKGGDIVSLAAYLSGVGQAAAARMLARMLGVDDV